MKQSTGRAEFRFEKSRSRVLGYVWRPMGRITLTYSRRSIELKFLLDAGADVTMIPFSAGRKIGLRIRERDKIHSLGGVGGDIPVVYKRAKMRIADVVFLCRIG